MNFRYIQGDWNDFYEAPDEAMLLVIDTCGRKYFTDIFPEPGGKYWSELSSHGVWGNAIKPDAFTLIAAREKLAEWDGEGLPPVGCECEFKANDGSWGIGTVLCVGKNRIFWLCHEDGDEYTSEVNPQEFRPVRSEANKKRDEVAKGLVEYLDKETDIDNVFSIQDVIGFYDAIAAGKIPHIRID
ncbi:TPA: hypothetical protein ACJIWE_000722 [Enterobacter roggenkampii]